MTCYTEEVIYAAALQVVRDVQNEDYTGIFELFENLPMNKLVGFLSEEQAVALREKWGVAEVDWAQ
jgi:hypothetical protein